MKFKTLTLIGASALILGLSTSFAEDSKKGDKEGKRPSKEEILAKFDTDGDGELSETEKAAAKAFKEANKGSRPSKEEMLETYDTDGDGELSSDEKKAMREAIKAERDANKPSE